MTMTAPQELEEKKKTEEKLTRKQMKALLTNLKLKKKKLALSKRPTKYYESPAKKKARRALQKASRKANRK